MGGQNYRPLATLLGGRRKSHRIKIKSHRGKKRGGNSSKKWPCASGSMAMEQEKSVSRAFSLGGEAGNCHHSGVQIGPFKDAAFQRGGNRPFVAERVERKEERTIAENTVRSNQNLKNGRDSSRES